METTFTRKTIYLIFIVLLFGANTLLSQNYALSFDGTNRDYVDLGIPASLEFDPDADAISVSAWFRVDDGNTGMIVCKSKNATAAEQQLSIGYSSQDIVFATVGSVRIDGNQQHDDGHWHHVCLTSDGSNFYLYVDGIQENSGTPGSYQNTSQHWFIGAREDDSDPFGYNFALTGDVDEVRIWDKKLSLSEVRTDMNNELGSPSTESNLLAYYSMSDGSGTTLSDDKGSLDGTISGANWIDPATSPIGDESIFSLGGADITESSNVSVMVTLSDEGSSYSYSAIEFNRNPSETSGLDYFPDTYWELWASDADFDGTFSATVRFYYDDLSITDENAITLYRRDAAGQNWNTLGGTVNPTNNYIEISIGDFSGQYIINSSTDQGGTFPVEMGEITAYRISKGVEIKWLTFSELNNDYFELQRSQNGEDFIAIGTVSGNGTTSEISQYSFVDQNAKENIGYYYRLKQVDYDGQNTESDVIFVPVANELDVTVYPTVANDRINFAVNKAAEIHVYNMQGALVKQFGTTGSTQINISDLPGGMYFYQVATNTERYSGKFVKE